MVRIGGESAVRQMVDLNPIQTALSDQRQKIADDAQARLQQLLDGYDIGIMVTQVQLRRINPPTAVIDAFNDVQRRRQRPVPRPLRQLQGQQGDHRAPAVPRHDGRGAAVGQYNSH